LPELVTTIVSSKKGEQDLLLGNIIGSNIFNICVVLGIPVAIFGTITPSSFQMLDLTMLIISTLLIFIFATTHRKVTRIEGTILLVIFAIYYTLVFVV
jgi:cation:H+ antiporter